jgi:raffinose/stachyose/melibiose transport system permease protein
MKRSKTTFALLILPSLVVYVVFMLIPLVASLGLSFFSWTGYGAKTFVGLSNFRKLFAAAPYPTRLLNALRNNLWFFLVTMLIQNVVALLLSVLIQRGLKGSAFFRGLFYAPSTVSVVIVGFIWTLIFNPNWGPLNVALRALGLGRFATAWTGKESTALFSIAVANAWQYTGIPMMLFIAALNNISDEQYEAVSIDGGNGWHKFWYITIPNIKPILFIVSTMTFVGNLSAFEVVYAMEGTLAGPNYSTDILGTFFYRTCFGARTGSPPDMGLGAAIAAVMTLIIGVGVVFWLRMYMKQDDS